MEGRAGTWRAGTWRRWDQKRDIGLSHRLALESLLVGNLAIGADNAGQSVEVAQGAVNLCEGAAGDHKHENSERDGKGGLGARPEDRIVLLTMNNRRICRNLSL